MNDIPAAEGIDTSLPDCVAQSGKSNNCNADGFIITGFTPARRKTGMCIWIAAFICFFYFFTWSDGTPDNYSLYEKHFIQGVSMFCLTNYYQ